MRCDVCGTVYRTVKSTPSGSYPDTKLMNAIVLQGPISMLHLPTRISNVVTALGVTTIGELASTNPNELLDSRNFGFSSLSKVQTALRAVGVMWQKVVSG